MSSLSLVVLVALGGVAGFSQLGRSADKAIAGVLTSEQAPSLVGSSAQAASASIGRAANAVRRFMRGGHGGSSSKRARELISRITRENDRTLTSYEERLGEYIAGTPTEVSPSSAQWIGATLERIKGDKRILEIGSGLGRDADYIEARGFDVLRSDAADSFVQHLRDQGHDAKHINVVTDDIAEAAGKQNAIFSNAVLLHLPESELRTALDNMRAALSDDGVLSFSVKRGVGEEWTDAKLGAPRYFRYWEPETLYPILEEHGFNVEWDLPIDNWLHVVARKQPAAALGDLTASEVQQIQAVVDAAGRPLEVVGSAAKRARRSGSDIDYLVPPSSLDYFGELAADLPDLDPTHGVVPGVHNPYIGPAIRFAPRERPTYIPRAN